MYKAFELRSAIRQLERTPEVLTALCTGVPETLLKNNEGEGSWSPQEVLAHLVYGEQVDWIPRTRIILEQGAAVTFTPFDRNGHKSLLQENSIGELLTMFADLRKDNMRRLSELHLTETELDKKGSHPELGEISLKEMLSAWVVHDLGHIVQISRVIGKAYKNDIGPWTRYLTLVRSKPAPEE